MEINYKRLIIILLTLSLTFITIFFNNFDLLFINILILAILIFLIIIILKDRNILKNETKNIKEALVYSFNNTSHILLTASLILIFSLIISILGSTIELFFPQIQYTENSIYTFINFFIDLILKITIILFTIIFSNKYYEILANSK